MNASLHQLYSRWREIAQQENLAIKSGSWNELDFFTKAKQELMEGIQGAELRQDQEAASMRGEVALLIHEVADLEQRNAELLAMGMAQLEGQLKDLKRRQRLSRQFRKNYIKPERGGKRTQEARA